MIGLVIKYFICTAFKHVHKLNRLSSSCNHKYKNSAFTIRIDDFNIPDAKALPLSTTPEIRPTHSPNTTAKSELDCKRHDVRECNGNTRINEVNIQMLSANLHKQIFGNNTGTSSLNQSKVDILIDNLNKFGLWKSADLVPDINLNLPKLQGRNIEEHFYNIGLHQSEPYKVLILNLVNKTLPKPPSEWICREGWTRYMEGSPPESVPFPNEEALVFDVEVCKHLGEAPTLATAVSSTCWYGWVSPNLPDKSNPVPVQRYTQDMFIPLEGREMSKNTPRIVIGHNVSYDRARVKEQYRLEQSGLRFFDTMSMHICIGGVTSYQRAMLKTKVDVEDNDWREYSSLNSLKEVYKLYCKKDLSKETRNIFVEGTLSDVRDNFQMVMTYCAEDVVATHSILSKMTPMFFDRFPHPVTLAGMLEMATTYLPINSAWQRYLTDSEQTYEDLEKECKYLLTRKSDNACQLMHDSLYKEDLWMWDEDWSTQELKVTKKKIKATEKTEIESEHDDGLDNKFQHIFDEAKKLPVRKPHLPGYPLWYRKLCEKPGEEDWVPGPQLISTGVRVAPKLLKLTWENYPVHHTKENGWGILVADMEADVEETEAPVEKLRTLTKKIGKLSTLKESGGLDFDLDSKLDTSIAKDEYVLRHGSDSKTKNQGLVCDNVVDGCFFIKLPHKDGPGKNVGNPLAKDFMKTFSSNVLAGADEAAAKVLDIGRKLSYWRNNRERISGQLTVWGNSGLGAILPQVVVCGTLTRRAMERTWMTASNAQAERIGSELRSMVQAPPGYHIVGADVDSQELWIASVMGDASHAGLHGATPFGRMTLIGNKADGSDMHSVTAAAAGISRDHAKVINYARIYGAGVRFAQRLLQQFNPEMSSTEAKSKAMKMFLLTKGRKSFRLKTQFRDQLDCDVDDCHTAFSAARISKTLGKPIVDVFDPPRWEGGTESAMFNRLEEVACAPEPRTPFLSARLSRAVEPRVAGDDSFMTTRINWVVQSGAVDFLHLMLVSLRWLSQGKMRFCLSFHDEVRYLVPSHLRYEAALALHITNLLTRSFCASRVGLHDLPQSVAFFASVEVDTVLRKEARDDCRTPSNPHGLEKGYGVPPGESVDIGTAIEKTNGRLSKLKPASVYRKHVISEIQNQEPRLPQPNQQIVRVVCSKGNNLHEVEAADNSTFLVSMPVKYRKNVWVKRGDYILVEAIEEGDKVKAEMVFPLNSDYIRFLKAERAWPSQFDDKDINDGGDDLCENTNRPNRVIYESSTDSSDES